MSGCKTQSAVAPLERHGAFLFLIGIGITVIVSLRLLIPIYLASKDDGDDFLFDK